MRDSLLFEMRVKEMENWELISQVSNWIYILFVKLPSSQAPFPAVQQFIGETLRVCVSLHLLICRSFAIVSEYVHRLAHNWR